MRIPIAVAFLACLIHEQPTNASENVRPLQPFIESIFPCGGSRGAEVQVSIRGKNLDNTTAIRVSGSGVTAHVLQSTDSEIRARFTIAAKAEPTRRDVRVFTPQGSFVQVFEVGSVRDQVESEPNDEPEKAQQIELPVVINGRVGAGDYDHFRFHAEAGQTIVCDLQSSRLGTRFDGVLWVLDSEGREVAFADDSYFDKDPRIVFKAHKKGEYVLRVSGFRESGSAAAQYRLLVGEMPYADAVFPAGGRRGTAVEVSLSGVNLNQITAIQLDGLRASATVTKKSATKLDVRIAIPGDSTPGIYRLRIYTGDIELPNGLPFVVSDLRELLADSGRDTTFDGRSPGVINGVIRSAHQKDGFVIDAAAGERWTFQGDAMILGNFLDPTVTIFDESGNVVAYMDEVAPNGFDKEPTTVDFRLVHRFEKSGRYRVEMRDAALHGHETFVYRLLIGKVEPRFEVYAQTNQVSVVPGQTATLPVRVRRFGGWDAPVEVWVDGLPARIESKKMIAEPANTRFRGTFSEDFFFDGTNVELPLQAHTGAKAGVTPVQVYARGSFEGHTMEVAAAVHYPWQQTGYLRGPGQDQQMMLTVAQVPLFELDGPSSIKLDSSGAADIPLSIRWSGAPATRANLKFEAAQLPEGVRIDRIEVAKDAAVAHVFVRATGLAGSGSLSLVGSVETNGGVYRKAARNIELVVAKPATAAAGGNTP